MNFDLKKYGDPVLRAVTEKVTEFDDSLPSIIEGMAEVLYNENGVGLAAPQVGLSKKIVIIDLSFGEKVDCILPVINPEILETEGECVMEEGCLSFPGIYEDIARPEKVKVRFQDINGETRELEADGFLARVIQHEFDHLDGILFVDRLSIVKKNLLIKSLRSIAEKGTID